MRGHLQADADYQERLIRFIENHDEPRAAATFGPEQARAAAVVMSTLQGARLYHDGQLEGCRTRIPVFLGRGPDEPPDDELRAFYERLLRAVADADLRAGDWRLCECTRLARQRLTGSSSRGAGRTPARATWSWSTSPMRPAQARVRLPWDGPAPGGPGTLVDRLSGQAFERDGDELGRRRPVRRARGLGDRTSCHSRAEPARASGLQPVADFRRYKSTALALGHASVSATPSDTRFQAESSTAETTPPRRNTCAMDDARSR